MGRERHPTGYERNEDVRRSSWPFEFCSLKITSWCGPGFGAARSVRRGAGRRRGGQRPAGDRLARDLNPDLVLMDLAMSELNGIDAARQLATIAPDVRVIMLSMHADEQYLFEALKAVRAGTC